ncbi:GGDEF domain-containing protein [Sulfurospirillum sp. 1307]
MKKLLFYSKNLFFIISSIVFFGSLCLYISFKNVIGQQQTKIHSIEVNRAHKTAKTIIPQINLYTNNSISNVINDATIEPDLSRILSYYRNDEFKYIYLVFIDKHGAFRYLADGSKLEDKATFHQKFTPSKERLWEKVLAKKVDVYDIQDSAEGLWLTYLSPIVVDGKVKAILALDISTKEYQEFIKLLAPLENFLSIFIFALAIIFFVILLQGYLYYKQYKNSMFDSLTKLYNRYFLEDTSNKLNKNNLAIFMIDIDFFKSVNDKYGHDVGDMVLQSVARKLLSATRLDDDVIRYGGEEFLVFIKSTQNKQHILDIAERIRASIEKDTIRINESLNVNVTVSIGVNLGVKSSQSINEAIKKADEMLYKAKLNGRNRIEVYEG